MDTFTLKVRSIKLCVMINLSGFDVGELSEDGPDDFEGLDASAAHIANLLSTEPADSNILYFSNPYSTL